MQYQPVCAILTNGTEKCFDQNYKQKSGIKVMNLEITRTDEEKNHAACALFMLQLNKKIGTDALLELLRGMQGVIRADEL